MWPYPYEALLQACLRKKAKMRMMPGHAPALFTDRAHNGKPACKPHLKVQPMH